MIGVSTTRSGPHVLIDASKRGIRVNLKELWAYRDLFWFLASRDITVRYKQSFLGFFWVVLQPLALMMVLTLFFGLIGRSAPKNYFGDPIPFPLYYFSALLIFQYFDSAVTKSMGSLSTGLITKIYLPRIILPAASVVPCLLDFAFSMVVFAGLFIWYKITLGTHLSLSLFNLIWLPLFLLIAMMTAFGVGTWFAALKIKYRDVNHIIPVITRIWFFASPVIYDASRIPVEYRFWYGLNPMVVVIEGFRWGLVHGPQPHIELLIAGLTSSLVLMISGVYFFLKTEKNFADDI